MAIATESIETMDDLLDRIGNVPLSRIRAKPAPGTATEADVPAAKQTFDRRCELVEGVLVEKAKGFRPHWDELVLDESATLAGEDVLPGFALELRTLFAELDRTQA